jgi:calcium-dependent protein kinase
MGCITSKTSDPQIQSSLKRGSVDSVTISASAFLTKSKGKLSTNYTIIRKLGSGAFADVQLCLYKPLNQERAVKMIHKAGLHQQQIDSKFMLKEISILTSLDHPNILKCYEIFEDSWKFYVAMDFCAGGELFDKIVQLKRFNESKAAEISFQILSALAYCHEKNVIHRDLKPENILFEEKGECFSIKVADFGSSCFLDKGKKLSGCFGSAYYVAPEVLRGEYNEKCDIWSVGVILFIMLTGRPPYRGSDEWVILEQVKTHPLQIEKSSFPNLSSESLDLLQKLLTVDVSTRISAKQALDHTWIMNFRNSQEYPDLSTTLIDLSNFSSSSKLKNAVHLFLASQAISHEELKVLKQEFLNIDKNGDGRISKSELIDQYRKTMDKSEASEVVEKIMKEVDTNHSGDIDYTEFLAACMKYTNLESKSNLETAFQMFDRDGSGFITVEEIKTVLGNDQILDSSVWREVVKEVDQNGDGVVDLREFILLMTQKFN